MLGYETDPKVPFGYVWRFLPRFDRGTRKYLGNDLNYKHSKKQVYSFISIIPEIRRPRQENGFECAASLGYKVSSRLAWAI